MVFPYAPHLNVWPLRSVNIPKQFVEGRAPRKAMKRHLGKCSFQIFCLSIAHSIVMVLIVSPSGIVLCAAHAPQLSNTGWEFACRKCERHERLLQRVVSAPRNYFLFADRCVSRSLPVFILLRNKRTNHFLPSVPPPCRRFSARFRRDCSVDMPWLVVPLALVLMMAADPTPFGPGSSHPVASKRK